MLFKKIEAHRGLAIGLGVTTILLMELGVVALLLVAGCGNHLQDQALAPISAATIAVQQDQASADQAWKVVMQLANIQKKQGQIAADVLTKAVNFKWKKEVDDKAGSEYFHLNGGAGQGENHYGILYFYDNRHGLNSLVHASNKAIPYIRMIFIMPRSGCIAVDRMHRDISSMGLRAYEKTAADIIDPDFQGRHNPHRFRESYYLGKGYFDLLYYDYKPSPQLTTMPNGQSRIVTMTPPHNRCVTEVTIESQG